MFRLWCVLIGYAFGLISFPYIFGRIFGVDIRQATNDSKSTDKALKRFKKKYGFISLLLDYLKIVLAVSLSLIIFSKGLPEYIYLIKLYTLAGCLVGHAFPLYLRLKGDDIVRVLLPFMLIFFWPMIPALVIIFAGIFFMTHFLSLACIFAYISFVIQIILFGNIGLFKMSELSLLEMYSVVLVIFLLVLFVYRGNIWRLFHNEEDMTFLGSKKASRSIVNLQKEEMDIISKEELNPAPTKTVTPKKVKRRIKKEKSHFIEPKKIEREIVVEEGPAFPEKEYKESRIQKKFIEDRNAMLAQETNPIEISLAEHNSIEYKDISELKKGVAKEVCATHQIDTLAIKEKMEELKLGGNNNE